MIGAAAIILRRTPLIAGVLAAPLGAAGLALWHLQASLTLPWVQHIQAMPHHVATAFLLSGIALGTATLAASSVTRALAGVVIFFAATNLAGHFLGLADDLEGIFASRYGAALDKLTWNMPPAAALAFAFAGAALAGAASRRRETGARHLVALLGASEAGLGLLALVCDLPDLRLTVGRSALAFMNEQVAAGHVVLGVGLVCLAYRRADGDDTSTLGWIGTVVVVGQLALTLLLWHGLERIIEEKQTRHLAAETGGLGQRFSDALQQRIGAIERMARRWEAGGGTARALWDVDAAANVADLPGFQAIQWVDADGIVRWVEPEAGNEAAVGLDNSRDPVRRQMLAQARDAARPLVTGPVTLVQGGRGLLLTRSLQVAGKPDGYLVAVFRTDDLLRTLSEEIATLNYGVEVTLAGETLFQRGAPPLSGRARAQTQAFTIDGGKLWQFRIWPTEAVLQRGPFSDLFLASGIAMTLLVAVAFRFWGRNAHAARELKRVNLVLRKERNFISSLIDNTSALSVVLDPDGRIVRFNHACEELSGYRFDELRGEHLWDRLLPPDDAAAWREAFARLLANDLPRYENCWVARDGREYRIAWSNSVMTDAEGRPEYVMGVGIDITERQRSADALVAAKDEADRANRAKSQFLSSMSHELRTPMNAVLGFAQLMALDDALPATHRDSVKEILKAGDLLMRLINDILNLSKIESGKLDVCIEPVSLDELVQECLSMVAPLAHDKGICVDSRLPAGLELRSDRQLLKQVLLNLLSNAIKYNRPAGMVRVDAAAGEAGGLRLRVSDTGHGIAADKLPGLFQPFNRLGAEHGSIEGTGIGLVVCKRLVEALGGAVAVASQAGRGSVFTVTLAAAAEAPASAPAAETAAAPPAVQPAPCSVREDA